MAALSTSTMPPVPSQNPISDGPNKSYFGVAWTQWFVQVKAKLDVINSSLVGLASVSGTGLTIHTSTGWTTASIQGTSGQVTVTNGDGISGNPTVALATTAVTPGDYTNTNLTVDQFGRIIAADNGTGGGGGTFISLTDVPNSYTGSGGYYLQVNLAENGIQFTAGTGTSVAWGSITGTLSSQTDLQTALDEKVDSIVAGAGISVDATDPRNPIVTATGTSTNPWVVVPKTSDETRASTTTFSDDASLKFNVTANTKYSVRGVVFTQAGSGSYKYQFAITAAPTYVYGYRVNRVPGSAVTATSDFSATGAAFPSGSHTDVGYGRFYIEFTFEASSDGVLSLQWAQNSSNAAASTFFTGSYLEYMIIP